MDHFSNCAVSTGQMAYSNLLVELSTMTAKSSFPTIELESSVHEKAEGRREVTVGQKIAAARKEAGYRTQYAAAEESQKFARRDPIRFASFSPQWLSKLENDATGALLDGARRSQVRSLEAMLGIDLSDSSNVQTSPATKATSAVHIKELNTRTNSLTGSYVQVHYGYSSGYESSLLRALVIDSTVLGSDEVRARIEKDSLVIVHSDLEPRKGDIIVLWIEDQGRTALTEYWPERRLTKLLSWEEHDAPLTLNEETEYKIRGIVISYPMLLRHSIADR